MRAMLPQIDGLPGAEHQMPVSYLQGQRLSQKRGENMRAHIIISLKDMIEIRRAIRHRTLKESLHIPAHIGIGRFIDGQRFTGRNKNIVWW